MIAGMVTAPTDAPPIVITSSGSAVSLLQMTTAVAPQAWAFSTLLVKLQEPLSIMAILPLIPLHWAAVGAVGAVGSQKSLSGAVPSAGATNTPPTQGETVLTSSPQSAEAFKPTVGTPPAMEAGEVISTILVKEASAPSSEATIVVTPQPAPTGTSME